MGDKKVVYKEPKGYFNADMMKAAKEWDKEQAAKKKAEASKSSTKKK